MGRPANRWFFAYSALAFLGYKGQSLWPGNRSGNRSGPMLAC